MRLKRVLVSIRRRHPGISRGPPNNKYILHELPIGIRRPTVLRHISKSGSFPFAEVSISVKMMPRTTSTIQDGGVSPSLPVSQSFFDIRTVKVRKDQGFLGRAEIPDPLQSDLRIRGFCRVEGRAYRENMSHVCVGV